MLCTELAQEVGLTPRDHAPKNSTCRLEIAMTGRDVTSIFLSQSNGCGGEAERESFLLVAPPAGLPGHAIDDEVWTT